MTAVDEEIGRALDEVERRIAVHDARAMVAVSGTSTTVQAIAMNLPGYEPERLHRTWLAREDAEHVLRLLADMSTDERRAIPSMAPGREDVIPVGAAILVDAMRRWGFDRALVSETDILDGLAFRLGEEMEAS
jgi:exopolyphosphatase/guanosine-5'-triphosphate,3'-diphosphate pyrophosphatase